MMMDKTDEASELRVQLGQKDLIIKAQKSRIKELEEKLEASEWGRDCTATIARELRGKLDKVRPYMQLRELKAQLDNIKRELLARSTLLPDSKTITNIIAILENE